MWVPLCYGTVVIFGVYHHLTCINRHLIENQSNQRNTDSFQAPLAFQRSSDFLRISWEQLQQDQYEIFPPISIDCSGQSIQTDNGLCCDMDQMSSKITMVESFPFGSRKFIYALLFRFPLHIKCNRHWKELQHACGGRGWRKEEAERQLCKSNHPGYLLLVVKGKMQFNFIWTRQPLLGKILFAFFDH